MLIVKLRISSNLETSYFEYPYVESLGTGAISFGDLAGSRCWSDCAYRKVFMASEIDVNDGTG